MDRESLIADLQKAFENDGQAKSAGDNEDTTFKENTSTLFVNEQKAFSMEKEPEIKRMSEEEVFERLLKQRRQK